MKRYILISAVFAASALTSYAGDSEAATGNVLHTQDMEEVLFSVRANNPELLSLEKSLEAQIIAIKGENMPEDPSVEYSSFYSSSVSGQSGSELVVSQGFEFPTLYAARHKRNELSREALGKSFDNERRRILLDAKLLCHDIIMYRQIGGA